MALDRADHLVGGEPELAPDPGDDPAVGLMRHQPVDVRRGQPVGGERLVHHLAQMLHRLAEHLAPFHPQKAGMAGRRRAAIDIEDVVLASVRMQMGREDMAAARPRLGHRLQHQCPGAVAEQDAGAAIVPVENAREGLGADHQSGARLPEPQRIVGGGERKDKPGAHRLDVEGRAPVHPQPRLHLGRGRREGVVRGGGRQNDQIEIAAVHAGAVERLLRRAHREIGGQLSGCGHAALADAGALADPRVGGVEAGGQIVVGHDPRGQIGAAPDDLGAQLHRRPL